MSFDVPKVPAFKEELVLSKLNKKIEELDVQGPWATKLLELEHSGQFVIRKSSERREEAAFDPKLEAAIDQKVFSELRDKYHINAPVHFVVAYDETSKDDKPDLFVLTEKVKKVDFSKMTASEKSNYAKRRVDLLQQLMLYHENKYASRERFLTDITHNEQYVYGATPDETENKWYLVDTDPYHSRRVSDLLLSVNQLSRFVELVEYQHALDLSPLKRRCATLSKNIEKNFREQLRSEDVMDLESTAEVYADPGI